MALLEASGIGKNFGETHVLKDISLDLEQGEALAIIGSSGSGKTTLMNMIGCMDTPSKGSVMLEGRRLEDLNARQLADVRKNMIGLVFQKFYLVPHLTAVENVMVAQYYHSVVDEKQAMEALERVGLKERAHHLPGQLSGGERNRVHLAKMLKKGANVILLDEPTNDLDVDTLRSLEEGISNYPGCVLVTSHDRWFLDRLATHILAYEDEGHVEWFEGNFEDYEKDKIRRLGEEACRPHRVRYKKLER